VLVVGTTNAGKTTMARKLAARLDVPHVELDALFWEPNWTEATDEAFFARIAEATSGQRWVACGNYSRARELLWPRADTLVWLDPKLRTILRRAVNRTIRRSLLRTDLWNTGNRERISNLWSQDDSLYKWAKRTHARQTELYANVMTDPAYAHLERVRLRSPRAARAWLRGVRSASPATLPR
jgi:adenylate kinase family enzyme